MDLFVAYTPQQYAEPGAMGCIPTRVIHYKGSQCSPVRGTEWSAQVDLSPSEARCISSNKLNIIFIPVQKAYRGAWG
jgi:hypothetical protein